MRTIHVELATPMSVGIFGQAVPMIRISTEAIVGDEADTREAGREACLALSEFIAGYVEAAEDATT